MLPYQILAILDLPSRFDRCAATRFAEKFAIAYSGLPWCCTQAGMPEPAEAVLGRHAAQHLAHGIIERPLVLALARRRPCLNFENISSIGV